MTIGERIKARRKEIGFSAEKIAADIGVSPATMYRYESSDKVPSQLLLPLAYALDTSVDWLIGTTEDKRTSPFVTPTERALIGERIRDELFDRLLIQADFQMVIDDDANVTIYSNDYILNKTPELVEKIMSQTLSYFSFLLKQEANHR